MTQSYFEDILFNPNISLQELVKETKGKHVTKLVSEGVVLATRIITSEGTTYN